MRSLSHETGQCDVNPAISRRRFLCTSGVTVLAVTFVPSAVVASPLSDNKELIEKLRLGAEKFLSTRKLTVDANAERLYLDSVQGMLIGANALELPNQQNHPWGSFPNQIKAGALEQPPLTLYFVTMQQGAVLPLHSHEDHLSLLEVLSGAFKVVTYRKNGTSVSDSNFALEQVSERILCTGDYSRVTSDASFHQITALEQATFVDIMTITGPRPGSAPIACDAQFRNCALT